MVYEYTLWNQNSKLDPPFIESVMDEIGDSDFYMEGVGNAIGKIVTSINTLVKRLVENFSKMMEKK